MSQTELDRQLQFEGTKDTPTLRPVPQSSTDGESPPKKLAIVTAIQKSNDSLFTLDLEERTLDDVEFTTSLETVASRREGTTVLVNPNICVAIYDD